MATKKTEKVVKTNVKVQTKSKPLAKSDTPESKTKLSAKSTAKSVVNKASKSVKSTKEKLKKAVKTVEKTVSKIATKKSLLKAKSAPTASEQTDVALKSVTKKMDKNSIVKKSIKPITKSSNLAHSYDPEYLVLMQKDPNWMQAFWEVSESRIKNVKSGKNKLVLRLFDISKDLTVKRKKKLKFRDIVVPENARSWYIENKGTDNCVAVLGVSQGKKFMPLVESAFVNPVQKADAQIDVNDIFVKASLGGGTLGGFGSSALSSKSPKNWLESLSSSSTSMFSGVLSSKELKNNKIETSKDSVNYGKDFFLWVKTRLIVYGGTRPDANLQVRGEPFPLNPDGTFSFEEDLPDSSKIIPVFATDKEGDFPTTIVPIVVKRTE